MKARMGPIKCFISTPFVYTGWHLCQSSSIKTLSLGIIPGWRSLPGFQFTFPSPTRPVTQGARHPGSPSPEISVQRTNACEPLASTRSLRSNRTRASVECLKRVCPVRGTCYELALALRSCWVIKCSVPTLGFELRIIRLRVQCLNH